METVETGKMGTGAAVGFCLFPPSQWLGHINKQQPESPPEVTGPRLSATVAEAQAFRSRGPGDF